MKEYLKKILPKSNLVQEFNGNFIYQVPLENLVVSELFQQIEQVKERFQISGMSNIEVDWGISQATLEDVFMRIVEEGISGISAKAVKNE